MAGANDEDFDERNQWVARFGNDSAATQSHYRELPKGLSFSFIFLRFSSRPMFTHTHIHRFPTQRRTIRFIFCTKKILRHSFSKWALPISFLFFVHSHFGLSDTSATDHRRVLHKTHSLFPFRWPSPLRCWGLSIFFFFFCIQMFPFILLSLIVVRKSNLWRNTPLQVLSHSLFFFKWLSFTTFLVRFWRETQLRVWMTS